jgi:hypothetical protein
MRRRAGRNHGVGLSPDIRQIPPYVSELVRLTGPPERQQVCSTKCSGVKVSASTSRAQSTLRCAAIDRWRTHPVPGVQLKGGREGWANLIHERNSEQRTRRPVHDVVVAHVEASVVIQHRLSPASHLAGLSVARDFGRTQ